MRSNLCNSPNILAHVIILTSKHETPPQAKQPRLQALPFPPPRSAPPQTLAPNHPPQKANAHRLHPPLLPLQHPLHPPPLHQPREQEIPEQKRAPVHLEEIAGQADEREEHREAEDDLQACIKSKVVKITHILMVKIEQEVKDTLGRLYEANEEYHALLKEWKRLEIFDETDELLRRVVDNYTDIIEDLMSKTLKETISTIDKYEAEIAKLTKENGQLKYLLDFQTNKFQTQMLELQSRVHEEYEKNQWATYLFNELSLQPYNLEEFIKGTTIYAKARRQYMHNPYFQYGRKLEEQEKQDTFISKQLCESEYLQSKDNKIDNTVMKKS